jgi:hypothetical protein
MTIDAWIMTGLLVGMFALLVWDQLPTWSEFIGTLTLAITLNLAPFRGHYCRSIIPYCS